MVALGKEVLVPEQLLERHDLGLGLIPIVPRAPVALLGLLLTNDL